MSTQSTLSRLVLAKPTLRTPDLTQPTLRRSVFTQPTLRWSFFFQFTVTRLVVIQLRLKQFNAARRKNRCTCAVNFGSSSRLFHFQNGGRRINNQHVIVMALGNILLAQGIYEQLGYFGQSLVQMF